MSVPSPTLTNDQGQHWGKNVGGEEEISLISLLSLVMRNEAVKDTFTYDVISSVARDK